MNVQVGLPEELAAEIDHVTNDRSSFVAEAVRRLLRESSELIVPSETDRINELADELNLEAADVLEYIS